MSTVKNLQQKLQVLGLETKGLKAELQSRITTHLRELKMPALRALKPEGVGGVSGKEEMVQLLLNTDVRFRVTPSSPLPDPSFLEVSMRSYSTSAPSSASSASSGKLSPVQILRSKLESLGLASTGVKDALLVRLNDKLDHMKKTELIALLPIGMKPGNSVAEIRRQVDSLDTFFRKLSDETGLEDALTSLSVTRPTSSGRSSVPMGRAVEIWNKWIGAPVGQCLCPLCQVHTIQQVNRMTWHCSHVKPHSKGGSIAVENMRPVCAACNISMKTENMFDYCSLYPGAATRLQL